MVMWLDKDRFWLMLLKGYICWGSVLRNALGLESVEVIEDLYCGGNDIVDSGSLALKFAYGLA